MRTRALLLALLLIVMPGCRVLGAIAVGAAAIAIDAVCDDDDDKFDPRKDRRPRKVRRAPPRGC